MFGAAPVLCPLLLLLSPLPLVTASSLQASSVTVTKLLPERGRQSQVSEEATKVFQVSLDSDDRQLVVRKSARKRTCGSDINCPYSYCMVKQLKSGSLKTYCPGSGSPRCVNLQVGEYVEMPGNEWCCKPSVINTECVQIKLTCGSDKHCKSRYCLAHTSTEITRCPTADEKAMYDARCNGINRHVPKWLSDDTKCCKSQNACKIPVRKCGTNDQCLANYCEKKGKSGNTDCPSFLKHVSLCRRLGKEQTMSLGSNEWCCKAIECDEAVKFCGGMPCMQTFCIGNRKRNGSFSTHCPTAEDKSVCEGLASHRVATGSKDVCCDADNCKESVRVCGDDIECHEDFCVAQSVEGSSEVTTRCPRKEEVARFKATCAAIGSKAEAEIGVGKWCCNTRHCSGNTGQTETWTIILAIVMAVVGSLIVIIGVVSFVYWRQRNIDPKAFSQSSGDTTGNTASDPFASPSTKNEMGKKSPFNVSGGRTPMQDIPGLGTKQLTPHKNIHDNLRFYRKEYYLMLGKEKDPENCQWKSKQLTWNAFERNRKLNRMERVPLADQTRVHLRLGHEHYIHASYVSGWKKQKEYICTQSPMGHTAEQFWLMVIQEKAPVILMLCDFKELGEVKSLRYFPATLGTSKEFGTVKVTNLGMGTDGSISETWLKVIMKSRGKGEKIVVEVLHLHYPHWPREATVRSERNVIRCIERMKEEVKKSGSGPPIIHCFAGVAQTGVLVILDSCFNMYDEKKLVNPPEILRIVRLQRLMAVTTWEQFAFINLVLVQYIKDQEKKDSKEDFSVDMSDDHCIPVFSPNNFAS